MSNEQSTQDFIAFQFVFAMAQQLDIIHFINQHGWTREEKRRLHKMVDRTAPRTRKQVLSDLCDAGESCDDVTARRVFIGAPTKLRWFVKDDIQTKLKENGSNYRFDILLQTNLVRWFSGKRYGISLDSSIAGALDEIDVDLSGLNVELPWNPMLINCGESEFFMWKNGETPYFAEFRMKDGQPALLKGSRTFFKTEPVEHSKRATAAWLCSISKGEGKEDYFELKVAGETVAILPRINASTVALKHKIASDTEADKGSWVRKGHFRITKDGPVWITGAVCREELPFVRKIHELKTKGSIGD
jgi:hypothetical protein